MEESQEIIIATQEGITKRATSYSDDLARSGKVANEFVQENIFTSYHKKKSENTDYRQKNDLAVFCRFLKEMHVERNHLDLYADKDAWVGISYGHVEAFRLWLERNGYSIGTINVRLATIRTYCKLAYTAGAISTEDITPILLIKGYSHSDGINVDEGRKDHARIGRKKATHTQISRKQVRTLKNGSLATKEKISRKYDNQIEARDILLFCLLTEHGLRCSEIVGLDKEHFDLEQETITIYRKKTKTKDTLVLMEQTRDAARTYFDLMKSYTGPLFVGYDGETRITLQAINKRVGVMGKKLDIQHLGPHDLRHEWALNAIRSGNSLDVVQAYGGWSSEAMPLRYAKLVGVTHKKLKLND